MKGLIFFWKSCLLSFLLSSSAHAYVDGGTGLLLLQGVFAAIGAVLVFVRKPWQYMTHKWFKAKKHPSQDA